MDALFLLLGLIYETVALEEIIEYYNVGTVLFSPSDTSKLRWSEPEVELLNARKQFLEILPPSNVLNIQDNDFARSILNYFKDAINVVKRETNDSECNSLMMTALSDTLGGFLNVWVLPITKLAYYAGSVPQDDALQLFKFHDDLKKYLNTDGKGWHKPNVNLINSMPLNIASLPSPSSTNSPNSCEGLAYLEKTKAGLAIPVPKVNWQKGAESMFVPLKNHTLIPLKHPNSSAALFQYYETAQDCIKSNEIKSNLTKSITIEDRQSYDDRLQEWLINDVIPHLNDEKLYPAFRSVLALVNITRNLCDNVMNCCLRNVPLQSPYKTLVAGNRFEFPSKKAMIITILIFLEIAWCIPMLCYLAYTKLKKRQIKNENVHSFTEPKEPPGPFQSWTESTRCKSSMKDTLASAEKTFNVSKMSAGGTQFPLANQNFMTKLSWHSVGTATRCNFQSQLRPKSTVMFDHGTSPVQKRSSKKTDATQSIDILPPNKKPSIRTELNPEKNYFDLLNRSSERGEESKTNSFVTVHELQNSVIVLNNNEPIEKDTEIVSIVDETQKTVETQSNHQIKRLKQKASTQLTDDCKNKQIVQSVKKGTKKTMKQTSHRENRKSNITKYSEKDVIAFKRGLRLTGKPYLEIIIDSPKRELTVDIDTMKSTKPSKIPKRFFTNTITQTQFSQNMKSEKEQNKEKSLIPKLKRYGVLDDILINRTAVSKENKLNVSL